MCFPVTIRGDISDDSKIALGSQKQVLKDFGGDIKSMAENPLGEDVADLDTQYKNLLAERAALLDPESEQYRNAVLAAEKEIADKKALFSDENYVDTLRSLVPEAYRTAGVRQRDAETTNIEGYLDDLEQFRSTGTVNPKYHPIFNNSKTLSGQAAQNFLDQGGSMSKSHYKHRSAMKRLLELANTKMGLDADLYGDIEGIRTDFGESGGSYGKAIGSLQKQIQDRYAGLQSAEDIVQQKLASLAGEGSFQDLASGADINKYDLLSQDQINKMNALKQLMGQQDLITEDQYDSSYVETDALKDLLNRYSGEGRYSKFAETTPLEATSSGRARATEN